MKCLQREGAGVPSPTPPLLAKLRRWDRDPERNTSHLTAWRSASLSVEGRGDSKTPAGDRYVHFQTVAASLFYSEVMSLCWREQVLFRVVLLTVLVATAAEQINGQREAGSSCYGGFDLYFVLDK